MGFTKVLWPETVRRNLLVRNLSEFDVLIKCAKGWIYRIEALMVFPRSQKPSLGLESDPCEFPEQDISKRYRLIS